MAGLLIRRHKGEHDARISYKPRAVDETNEHCRGAGVQPDRSTIDMHGDCEAAPDSLIRGK
jgi:hypothetical protein